MKISLVEKVLTLLFFTYRLNFFSMGWNLPPFLGVGLPCLFISSIGYGGHLTVFHKQLSLNEQLWFQFCLTCLWISYISAIYKDPVSPPKEYKPHQHQWKRYCTKCKGFKPERTHHCKTCKKCVLKMDHHCPWIANCVGHGNMPHFLRFLLWVDYTNGIALYQLSKRLIVLWKDRNLPIYLISKLELVMVLILTPMSIIVELSVGVMTIRWFYNILFTGMTQIESWEYERIESQIGTARFWKQIQSNYKQKYGKDLKSVTSWATSHRSITESLENDDSTPFFTIDDLIFPYDINPWVNLLDAFGYPWNWLLFWGKPLGDGITFKKNEFVDYTGEDELSSLPWPPDTGDDKFLKDNETVVKSFASGSDLDWFNSYGERLSDFGVDTETEDTVEVLNQPSSGHSSGSEIKQSI